MKRLLIMIAALAVCGGLVLSGCKAPENENDGGNNNSSDNSVSESNNENDSDGGEDNNTENDSDSSSDSDIGNYTDIGTAEFIHSTYDEHGRFVCEYLGFGAELGEEWIFASDNDLSNMNSGSILTSDEEYKEYLESNRMMADMAAAGEQFYFESGSSGTGIANMIYLLYANTAIDTEIGDMTPEEYIDTSIEKGVLSEMYSKVEKNFVSFAGRNTVCLDLTGDMYGNTVSERHIVLRKGDYMVNVRISIVGDKSDLDEITSKFYSL